MHLHKRPGIGMVEIENKRVTVCPRNSPVLGVAPVF